MFTTLALQTMILAFPAPREREPVDKGPGFVGITFGDANESGVLVTEVRPGGPADLAGMKADDIIRKFDGERISFENFPRRIIRYRPGTIVPVEILRGNKTLAMKVTIGLRPDDYPYPLPTLNDDDPTTPPEIADPTPAPAVPNR